MGDGPSDARYEMEECGGWSIAGPRIFMKTHELKTDPEPFDQVASNDKTFEIRKDDRDFKVGDKLILRKTVHTGAEMAEGKPLEYTGDVVTRRIIHIMRGPAYGLAEGWVIMSIDVHA